MSNDLNNLVKELENAINKGDFSKINKTIKNTVHSTVDATLDQTKKTIDTINLHVNSFETSKTKTKKTIDTINLHVNSFETSKTKTSKTEKMKSPPPDFQQPPQQKSKLVPTNSFKRPKKPLIMTKKVGFKNFLIILILILAYCSAITILSELILFFTSTALNFVYLSTYSAALALNVFFIAKLTLAFKKNSHYKKFGEMFAYKSFWSIEDLAKSVRLPEKKITKEIEKLIYNQYFCECYLSDDKKYLLVGNDTYNNFLISQQQYLEKKQQEKYEATLDPIILEGRNYVKQIRSANDLLPDKIITQKLSDLENVIAKIFAYVEQRPNKLSQIRKFMDYYLPTTVKLIFSYCEFEKQSIQGENIKTAKTEILDALDTINSAFNTLLNELYKEDAIDISSDISVLKQMLAQEGLSENELKL